MEYTRLGSTGLKVSRLGLGCGNFGGIGSAPAFFGMGENEAQAAALMDRAFDAGINFFDTADAYGGGRSEEYIGRWLAAKGSAARQQLLLSSKVFNPVGPGPNDRGLSRRQILRQADASLARLQTDRLDLYLIHEPDPETPLDETLEALNDLVRMGKVLYVGASNIEAWRLARGLWTSEVRKLARFEWVQNSYSLLDRTPERELFPLLADTGVGFTAFSPLAGGWLSGKYRAAGAYPGGLAHEAAAGAVPAPRFRARVPWPVGIRRGIGRARRRHDGAGHRLGAASSARERGDHRPADDRAARRRAVGGGAGDRRRRRRAARESVLMRVIEWRWAWISIDGSSSKSRPARRRFGPSRRNRRGSTTTTHSASGATSTSCRAVCT
jgi:aryl-alcohol dehydrogenase-like predicted oxidoreductase